MELLLESNIHSRPYMLVHLDELLWGVMSMDCPPCIRMADVLRARVGHVVHSQV